MKKPLICAVCYTTAKTKEHPTRELFNYETTDGAPACSMECRLKWLNETPVERTARIGMDFVDASLMMHMWMSIGRTDEPEFEIIQTRRQLQCEQIQRLAQLDEVKAVKL